MKLAQIEGGLLIVYQLSNGPIILSSFGSKRGYGMKGWVDWKAENVPLALFKHILINRLSPDMKSKYSKLLKHGKRHKELVCQSLKAEQPPKFIVKEKMHFHILIPKY